MHMGVERALQHSHACKANLLPPLLMVAGRVVPRPICSLDSCLLSFAPCSQDRKNLEIAATSKLEASKDYIPLRLAPAWQGSQRTWLSFVESVFKRMYFGTLQESVSQVPLRFHRLYNTKQQSRSWIAGLDHQQQANVTCMRSNEFSKGFAEEVSGQAMQGSRGAGSRRMHASARRAISGSLD